MSRNVIAHFYEEKYLMKDWLSENDWQSEYQAYQEIKEATPVADGDRILVESTSGSTASITPIILYQSDTDVTRIIFEPTFIDNIHDSNKCIAGKLIYEKRSKWDNYPTEKITPRSVKTGEVMEISLGTTAVIKLFQSLSQLYDLYDKDGIPSGYAYYKRVDNSFNNFLELLKNNPAAAHMIADPENYELVKILLQMITKTDSVKSLENALHNLQNDSIGQLSKSISIERLSRVITLIETNLDNTDEEFWQTTVFKENQWVLAQVFATPCTILKDKAYVGGKSLNNNNGNLCDFLYQNKITNNVALIEIKTPKTKIIHGPYRHTYSFTNELSGAINQVINYRDSLMKEYNNLIGNTQYVFSAFNPKCVVIIGKLADMDASQIAAFENYRNSLNNIEIITYDEILIRLRDLRNIFSSDVTTDASNDEDMPF